MYRNVLLVIALGSLFACTATEGKFGNRWRQVEFASADMMPPPNVVDFAKDSIRLNGVGVDGPSLLANLAVADRLNPAPAVYLRFFAADAQEAAALAGAIRQAGACNHTLCVFKANEPISGQVGVVPQSGSAQSLESR